MNLIPSAAAQLSSLIGFVRDHELRVIFGAKDIQTWINSQQTIPQKQLPLIRTLEANGFIVLNGNYRRYANGRLQPIVISPAAYKSAPVEAFKDNAFVKTLFVLPSGYIPDDYKPQALIKTPIPNGAKERVTVFVPQSKAPEIKAFAAKLNWESTNAQ